jgi:hypothetical protein
VQPTKIGNRIIVIGRPAPATENSAHREPTGRRAKTRRIVIIKNGELVGGRSGR